MEFQASRVQAESVERQDQAEPVGQTELMAPQAHWVLVVLAESVELVSPDRLESLARAVA